jgi:soluble lytic murein transglycosylase-like protein
MSLGLSCILVPCESHAGAQKEEALSDAFRLVLSAALHNQPVPEPLDLSNDELKGDFKGWFEQISPLFQNYLLQRRGAHSLAELASTQLQREFLKTVWYESKRAGLEPSLVMGVIQQESGFNKFAISSAGALGYMQVMPFWLTLARSNSSSAAPVSTSNSGYQLLHLQTNIRFGCVILKHYWQEQSGDWVQALGRYNGNVQDASYARAVLAHALKWQIRPGHL